MAEMPADALKRFAEELKDDGNISGNQFLKLNMGRVDEFIRKPNEVVLPPLVGAQLTAKQEAAKHAKIVDATIKKNMRNRGLFDYSTSPEKDRMVDLQTRPEFSTSLGTRSRYGDGDGGFLDRWLNTDERISSFRKGAEDNVLAGETAPVYSGFKRHMAGLDSERGANGEEKKLDYSLVKPYAKRREERLLREKGEKKEETKLDVTGRFMQDGVPIDSPMAPSTVRDAKSAAAEETFNMEESGRAKTGPYLSLPPLSQEDASIYFGSKAKVAFYDFYRQMSLLRNVSSNPTELLSAGVQDETPRYEEKLAAEAKTEDDRVHRIKQGIISDVDDGLLNEVKPEDIKVDSASNLLRDVHLTTPHYTADNGTRAIGAGHFRPASARSRFIAACVENDVGPRPALMMRKDISPTLSLRGQYIGDKLAATLGMAMEVLPYLQYLDLASNALTEEGLVPLLDALGYCQHLIGIDLSDNKVSLKAIDALAAVLSDPDCTVSKLTLQLAGLTDSTVKYLLDAISVHNCLRELDLSRNGIGAPTTQESAKPDGVAALASVIAHPSCGLEVLNLAWNNTRASLPSLARALAINNSLLSLDLSFNGLDNAAGEMLGGALFGNKTLQKLSVAQNKLMSRAAFTIVCGVYDCPTLRNVDMSNNPIGLIGVRAVVQLQLRLGWDNTKINIAGCSTRMKDPSCWFDAHNPFTTHELDLSVAYDRAVCSELHRLIVENERITVVSYRIDGEALEFTVKTEEPLPKPSPKSSPVKTPELSPSKPEVEILDLTTKQEVVTPSQETEDTPEEVVNSEKKNAEENSWEEEVNMESGTDPTPNITSEHEPEVEVEVEADAELEQKAEMKVKVDVVEEVAEEVDVEIEAEEDAFDIESACDQFVRGGRTSMKKKEMDSFWQTLGKSDRAARWHTAELFRLYDVDGSGAIELVEFKAFVHDMQLRKDHAKAYGKSSAQSLGRFLALGSARTAYIVPNIGTVNVELQRSGAIPAATKTVSSAHLDKFVRTLRFSADSTAMLEEALSCMHFQYIEARVALNWLIKEHGDKIRALALMLPRLIRPNDARALVLHAGLNCVDDICSLKKRMGSMYNVSLGSYTGFYFLNMKSARDRECMTRLLEMCSFAKKCRHGEDLGDTSQIGDWSCFRNIRLDNEPYALDCSLGASAHLPETGSLQFDFVYAVDDARLHDGMQIPDTKLFHVLHALQYKGPEVLDSKSFSEEVHKSQDITVIFDHAVMESRFTIVGSLMKHAHYRTSKAAREFHKPYESVSAEEKYALETGSSLAFKRQRDAAKKDRTRPSTAVEESEEEVKAAKLPQSALMESFRKHINCLEECKAVKSIDDLKLDLRLAKRRFDVLTTVLLGKYLSSAQLAAIVWLFPNEDISVHDIEEDVPVMEGEEAFVKVRYSTVRVELVVTLFSQVVDKINMSLVLSCLNADEQAALIVRIGMLNLMNIITIPPFLKLDLARREDVQFLRCLLIIREMEKNWASTTVYRTAAEEQALVDAAIAGEKAKTSPILKKAKLEKWVIRISNMSCSQLPGLDTKAGSSAATKKSDPFLVFVLGEQQKSTRFISNTNDPVWSRVSYDSETIQEGVEFDSASDTDCVDVVVDRTAWRSLTLLVKIKDHDNGKEDDSLGEVQINLSEYGDLFDNLQPALAHGMKIEGSASEEATLSINMELVEISREGAETEGGEERETGTGTTTTTTTVTATGASDVPPVHVLPVTQWKSEGQIPKCGVLVLYFDAQRPVEQRIRQCLNATCLPSNPHGAKQASIANAETIIGMESLHISLKSDKQLELLQRKDSE